MEATRWTSASVSPLERMACWASTRRPIHAPEPPSIHTWPSSRTWPSGSVSVLYDTPVGQSCSRLGTSRWRPAASMVWRSAVPRRRCAQRSLFCMVGYLACAGRDIDHRFNMPRFLVSLLRHTLTSEGVTVCAALVAMFGKNARDVSCECSPRVRLGVGSVCCDSGKTVLGSIKNSEKTAENVVWWLSVLTLPRGNVAACSHSCTWLRFYGTSLSRRIEGGVCKIIRLASRTSKHQPARSFSTARDINVQEFAGKLARS